MDNTLNRLRQSRYLSALLDTYYSSNNDAQRSLDTFINAPAKEQQSHLLGFIPRVKAAQNAMALQELKNEFTIFWSLASLASTLGFAPLSTLQSDFAAATIDRALNLAWQETTQRLRLKPAQEHADASSNNPPKGLFILGLGKLGGQDLNFSSDVDLIGFYDPEILPIPKHLGQAHICNKVLQALTQILNPRNQANFIWRVDWRLRPESSARGLAMSIHDAEIFYFTRALPWHRLALMKARPIGGDITAGKAFLEQITPFIWRQNLDFRAIDELADLKTRINQEHPALSHERAAPSPITADLNHFNVKLGRGGIREIEFIANAQQLLWGGKHYALRTTNTLNALQSLSDLQLMPAQDCLKLTQIYKQLRRLENAIQMVDNAHSHLVPEFGNTRDILARLLGVSDWEAYSAQIRSAREYVNKGFNALFFQNESVLPELELGTRALNPKNQDIIQSWLEGFSAHGINPQDLPRFAPLGRALAQRVINIDDKVEDSLAHIDRFLKDMARSTQYLHLLRRNPTLLDALITPLLHSAHMTQLLQQSPHIIDIFLSRQSYVTSDKATYRPDTRFILAEPDYETRLERLRRFVNEHLFQYYHEFIQSRDNALMLQQRLTDLAQITIDCALEIAREDLGLEALPICVLGLGKLGTQRMAPLSDLDVIFIFDDNIDPSISSQIVRRIRTILTVKLREGIAYELDMRLRPSGRSGPAAVSLNAFEKHHQERAKSWEHIALAHSRIIAGDPELGAQVNAIKDNILERPRDLGQFNKDAALMWSRINAERIADLGPEIINAKLRRGGLMQAEYLDACAILTQKDRDMGRAIAFFSHQQIWERLLGLTGKTLTDCPARFLDALLGGQSLEDYQEQICHHQDHVNQNLSQSLGQISFDDDYRESPIIWRDIKR